MIVSWKWSTLISLPFPLVWSPEGPVPEDSVAPLCRVQSNLSFLSCWKPHIDTSKLHVIAKTNKQESVTKCVTKGEFSYLLTI